MNNENELNSDVLVASNINIAEDVWSIISDLVYNGPLYQNKNDLEKSINEAIFILNSSRGQQIIDLYNRFV